MRISVVFLSPLLRPAYRYAAVKRASTAFGCKEHNMRKHWWKTLKDWPEESKVNLQDPLRPALKR
jgi:hypothetical protein